MQRGTRGTTRLVTRKSGRRWRIAGAAGAVVLVLAFGAQVADAHTGTVGEWRFDEADIRGIAADRERKPLQLAAFRDTLIARQHDGDVAPEPCQSRRQRPEHVRQATRFRERLRFGSNLENREPGRWSLVFGRWSFVFGRWFPC